MSYPPTWCHTQNAPAAGWQLWRLGRAGVEVGAGKKWTEAATTTTMNIGAEGEEATTAAGGKETIIAVVDAGRAFMRCITG